MIYEDYLIFTPGPVKMYKETLKIGAKQTPYFRNTPFSEVVLKSEKLLLEFLNAPKNSRVIFLTASGTAGLESVIMNLFNLKNKSFIVNGGGFGKRFVDLAQSYEVDYKEIIPNNHNLSDIDKKNLITKGFDTFIVNAHETSIGLLYDLDAIGKFCNKHNLLNIVDAISMFVTDELDMQKQNIDVVILSSQKGLALPPGLTMVVLSPKAIERVNDVKSHYFNFKNYLKNGERGQTPYTPAVTIILQLLDRLERIKNNGGIKNTINRAKEIAIYFREGIKNLNLPLKFYTKYMPNAMTSLTPISNKSAINIVNLLEKEYKIIVCPNGGELRDKIFRVSHMGEMTKEDVDILLEALNKIFEKEA